MLLNFEVVDKVQSGGKSKRDGWQTELRKVELGGNIQVQFMFTVSTF